MVYVVQNHKQEAIELEEQALDTYIQIGDIWGQGRALQHLGMTYFAAHDYARAKNYLEQAMHIFIEVESQYHQIISYYKFVKLKRFWGYMRQLTNTEK